MTVAEFRANLRQCLDAAVQGETIIIERMGQRFMLIADARTKPLADNEIITEDGARAIVIPKHTTNSGDKLAAMHDLNEKINSGADAPSKDYDFCKHGNVKRFCKKGCK